MSTVPKPPEILDKIVDLVLSHRRKPLANAKKPQRAEYSLSKQPKKKKKSTK